MICVLENAMPSFPFLDQFHDTHLTKWSRGRFIEFGLETFNLVNALLSFKQNFKVYIVGIREHERKKVQPFFWVQGEFLIRLIQKLRIVLFSSIFYNCSFPFSRFVQQSFCCLCHVEYILYIYLFIYVIPPFVLFLVSVLVLFLFQFCFCFFGCGGG